MRTVRTGPVDRTDRPTGGARRAGRVGRNRGAGLDRRDLLRGGHRRRTDLGHEPQRHCVVGSGRPGDAVPGDPGRRSRRVGRGLLRADSADEHAGRAQCRGPDPGRGRRAGCPAHWHRVGARRAIRHGGGCVPDPRAVGVCRPRPRWVGTRHRCGALRLRRRRPVAALAARAAATPPLGQGGGCDPGHRVDRGDDGRPARPGDRRCGRRVVGAARPVVRPRHLVALPAVRHRESGRPGPVRAGPVRGASRPTRSRPRRSATSRRPKPGAVDAAGSGGSPPGQPPSWPFCSSGSP